jgi:hypothetical protein
MIPRFEAESSSDHRKKTGVCDAIDNIAFVT